MVRDRVSANTINSAPRTAETGNTLRCGGPQSSLATPNQTVPTMNSRRRPKRSPS